MKPLLKLTLSLLSVVTLGSCSSVTVKNYDKEKPTLKLEEYFNGDIDAYGIFQDRSGKVIKRFHVLIKASWAGNTGILDESFDYSDGSKSKRIWKLVRQDDNTYTGTAGDVIGQARGEVAGNAFFWKYVLDLEVDGTHYHVTFDDWMYLMNDQIMLNKSKMSKLGVSLGEVTLTFIKRGKLQ
ncbi:MAG: DUF3833 domain-containing protein [Bdellovibrionaceae bacterium]|nr:DUF3833 domain-containing protein [Pseudobdellovibrionaceae bacterium]